jgi:hypothetical protein
MLGVLSSLPESVDSLASKNGFVAFACSWNNDHQGGEPKIVGSKLARA